jgi:hypothetical protein
MSEIGDHQPNGDRLRRGSAGTHHVQCLGDGVPQRLAGEACEVDRHMRLLECRLDQRPQLNRALSLRADERPAALTRHDQLFTAQRL